MWQGSRVNLKRLLLIPVASLLLAGCAQDTEAPETTTPTATTPQADYVDCRYNVSGTAARPVDPPPTANVPATGTAIVTLRLTQGPISLTLDREHAPCTVNSFLSLLNQNFYTDTTCHRLTTEGIFVLQCGDPTGVGNGGPGYSFPDETFANDTYPAGTVAMANSGPDTNGSQFFLVYQDSSLAPNYTVFGHFDADSLKVLEAIALNGQDDSRRSGDGQPNEEVRIEGYSMG